MGILRPKNIDFTARDRSPIGSELAVEAGERLEWFADLRDLFGNMLAVFHELLESQTSMLETGNLLQFFVPFLREPLRLRDLQVH